MWHQQVHHGLIVESSLPILYKYIKADTLTAATVTAATTTMSDNKYMTNDCKTVLHLVTDAVVYIGIIIHSRVFAKLFQIKNPR